MKDIGLTDEEKMEVARGIDEVTEVLGPVLNKLEVKPQSKAMALALMAAHEVLHDGGNEADFQSIAGACWRRSLEVHSRDCAQKN